MSKTALCSEYNCFAIIPGFPDKISPPESDGKFYLAGTGIITTSFHLKREKDSTIFRKFSVYFLPMEIHLPGIRQSYKLFTGNIIIVYTNYRF